MKDTVVTQDSAGIQKDSGADFPDRSPQCRGKIYAVIISLYILAYLIPLGIRPLILPDETRYAEVPREMIATGNWVAPRLDGVRYFEKPVLGYWLNAASMDLLGQSRFAVRLPSALAAGLVALLLFVLVSRHGGESSSRATLAVGVLLSSVFFFGIGTFAVLDMPLTLFLTSAMVWFYFAYRETGGRRRIYEALFGVSCGLAFLTKGFLAFAVPVVTIVPFMLWEKRWRELFTMVWVPALCAVLVALPWSLAIHHREPDFWNFFFWHEHIKRFFSDHPQHPEAFWFFIPVLLVALFPWTVLLPAAVRGLKREDFRKDTLLRYCLCWFLFPFLFFSASRGKLATYILPCLPPAVLLVASGLQAYLGSKRRKAFDRGAYASAALVTAIALVLTINEALGVDLIAVFDPEEWDKLLLGGLALGVWAATHIAAGLMSKPQHKSFLFALAPVLFMLVAGACFPDAARTDKAPERFLERHAVDVTPQTTVVADHRVVRAVCWVWRRDDVMVAGGPGELEYGLSQSDAKGRLIEVEELAEMIRNSTLDRHIVLIALSRHYRKWKTVLPQPTRLDADHGFVFAEFTAGDGDVATDP